MTQSKPRPTHSPTTETDTRERKVPSDIITGGGRASRHFNATCRLRFQQSRRTPDGGSRAPLVAFTSPLHSPAMTEVCRDVPLLMPDVPLGGRHPQHTVVYCEPTRMPEMTPRGRHSQHTTTTHCVSGLCPRVVAAMQVPAISPLIVIVSLSGWATMLSIARAIVSLSG